MTGQVPRTAGEPGATRSSRVACRRDMAFAPSLDLVGGALPVFHNRYTRPNRSLYFGEQKDIIGSHVLGC